MEELTINDTCMLFDAGTCAADVISIRGCQLKTLCSQSHLTFNGGLLLYLKHMKLNNSRLNTSSCFLISANKYFGNWNYQLHHDFLINAVMCLGE